MDCSGMQVQCSAVPCSAGLRWALAMPQAGTAPRVSVLPHALVGGDVCHLSILQQLAEEASHGAVELVILFHH